MRLYYPLEGRPPSRLWVGWIRLAVATEHDPPKAKPLQQGGRLCVTSMSKISPFYGEIPRWVLATGDLLSDPLGIKQRVTACFDPQKNEMVPCRNKFFRKISVRRQPARFFRSYSDPIARRRGSWSEPAGRIRSRQIPVLSQILSSA